MGVRVRQKVKGKGNPWWVFISHNGKRTSRKVGDKKASEAVASMIRAKLQLGEFGFEDQKPAFTFKEYSKMWLALPHDWKESTRENYENNLKKHALPYLGSIPVNEIKRKNLKSFFDKKYAEGLNLNTIKLIRAPINGILSYAVELELIESNPMRDLVLKYKKKKFESSIKITYDVYAHWIPGQFKSEVDELDNLHPNAPTNDSESISIMISIAVHGYCQSRRWT